MNRLIFVFLILIQFSALAQNYDDTVAFKPALLVNGTDKFLVDQGAKSRVAKITQLGSYIWANPISGATNTTIQGLRNMTTASTKNTYYVTDKGKEGPWRYDSLDVSTSDNLGLCVVSGTSLRFKRIYTGLPEADWFIINPATTNQTTALQSAINLTDIAFHNKKTYYIDSLTIPVGRYVDFGNITLTPLTRKGRLILLSNCTIGGEKFTINLNKTATKAISIKGILGTPIKNVTLFGDITIKNPYPNRDKPSVTPGSNLNGGISTSYTSKLRSLGHLHFDSLYQYSKDTAGLYKAIDLANADSAYFNKIEVTNSDMAFNCYASHDVIISELICTNILDNTLYLINNTYNIFVANVRTSNGEEGIVIDMNRNGRPLYNANIIIGNYYFSNMYNKAISLRQGGGVQFGAGIIRNSTISQDPSTLPGHYNTIEVHDVSFGPTTFIYDTMYVGTAMVDGVLFLNHNKNIKFTSILAKVRNSPPRTYLFRIGNSTGINLGDVSIVVDSGFANLPIGLRISEGTGDTVALNPYITVRNFETRGVTAPYTFSNFKSKKDNICINTGSTKRTGDIIVSDTTITDYRESAEVSLLQGEIISQRLIKTNDASSGGTDTIFAERVIAFAPGNIFQTNWYNKTKKTQIRMPTPGGATIKLPTVTTELDTGMVYNYFGTAKIFGYPIDTTFKYALLDQNGKYVIAVATTPTVNPVNWFAPVTTPTGGSNIWGVNSNTDANPPMIFNNKGSGSFSFQDNMFMDKLSGTPTNNTNQVGSRTFWFRSFLWNGTAAQNKDWLVRSTPVSGTNNGHRLTFFETDSGTAVEFDKSGGINFKHICGASLAPTITAGTGAGTSPTIAISGTDMAGTVTVTTGTSPSTSAIIATVRFHVAYATAPIVIAQGGNTNAFALTGSMAVGVPVSGQTNGTTTTTFVLQSGATGLSASTQYIFTYHVIQ